MSHYFSCPNNVLRLSSHVLIVGTLMTLAGILFAYLLDLQLSIPQQVVAHGGVILGPTLIKIGYVMRLLAQYAMRKAERLATCVAA
ncbi:transmembrane sensor/regulator PpyR [Pseudomonas sp. UL073]|uniref:Transmembrane sensor/regulator PpyR n=1 Tax=Zestomonas insulae TaxID=2809017 RepID=A0ABS2ICH7_9GAMM|nr:transmembrane sensor/regulator PpyR [Pseudomonas insulae]MBM7060647.1 transmembrane sensor/regulator PpyR [Pseudomonas insulae]